VKRGGRLPPKSEKRRRLDRERAKFTKRMLALHAHCQACGPRRALRGGAYRVKDAVDVHELVKRSQGGSIVDEANVLCVCRLCHDWIEDHPTDAEERGLALPSWATPAMRAEASALRGSWGEGIPRSPTWWEAPTTA
jgi:hypothetical protein